MALTKAKASNILLTTPAASSNDVTPATTEYVTTALANLVDSAPSTLNTLNELAAALGDDANFSTTVTNSIAGKLPLAGGTMTGHILLNNAVELRSKDTSSNIKTITRINSSNELEYGWSGSGPVKFMGGGAYTERMRIHTDGNIGIGNTTPQAKLHVTDGATILDMTDNGYGGLKITDDSSSDYNVNFITGRNQGNTRFNFYRSGRAQGTTPWSDTTPTKIAHFSTNSNYFVGSVGIGTTAPDLTLHVDGTNALPATSGSTPNGMLTLRAKTGSSSHGLFMGVSNASPWGSWLQSQDVNNLANNYPLLLNPNGGSVGIGTTSPGGLLTISGTGDAIRIESTNSGEGGAQMDMLHFSSSPADNDVHGVINFGGYYSGSSSAYGSSIKSIWTDVSAKEAKMEFFTRDDSDFSNKMSITKDYAIPKMNFHYAEASSTYANVSTTGDESSNGSGVLMLKQQISVTAGSKILVWWHSGQILNSQGSNSNPQICVYVSTNATAPSNRTIDHAINSDAQHQWYPASSQPSARIFLSGMGATGTLSTGGTYYIYVYGGSYNSGSFTFNYQDSSTNKRGSNIIWAEVMA